MSHGRNKYQSRGNRSVVRKVLMQEWDPIGVRLLGGAEEEYDAYVGKVYVMLMDEHASADAIADYLLKTATGHIGMPRTPELLERCGRTAEMLVSLRPSFETH